MAFGFMKKISPEYVVEHAVMDMRTAGLDGLKPYLTENAEKKVDTIRSVSSGMDLLTGGSKSPSYSTGFPNATGPSSRS